MQVSKKDILNAIDSILQRVLYDGKNFSSARECLMCNLILLPSKEKSINDINGCKGCPFYFSSFRKQFRKTNVIAAYPCAYIFDYVREIDEYYNWQNKEAIALFLSKLKTFVRQSKPRCFSTISGSSNLMAIRKMIKETMDENKNKDQN